MAAPLLVLGVGNPSRGDDALGPLFVERAEQALADEVRSGAVELITDYQLQIEHALDLTGRQRVLFVDASVTAAPPFELSRIAPRRDRSLSTHALSPEAVLETYRALSGEPPEAWVLAMRGERFELGEGLSERASAHLDAALDMFVNGVRGDGLFDAREGRLIEVEGTVQGVGFRPWVYRVARELALTGGVWNTPRGVSIEAFGRRTLLERLLARIQGDSPPAARLRSVRVTSVPLRQLDSFEIRGSEPAIEVAAPRASAAEPNVAMGAVVLPRREGATLALPPDLATCAACAREVSTLGDRHHGYAFTSCMDCGPRLSVATALPYDRPATTLAPFTPCAACAREYTDALDRRFHAQTIACPACGPRLWLEGAEGRPVPHADPIAAAAALLGAGQVLAVQGLGAFHLVCDATDGAAVAELRRRKRRELQPFAVMVADLDAAGALVELEREGRAALASSARPIVLAPSRARGAGVEAPRLAAEVNGPSRRTGVMLPYTPLHQRLVEHVGRPLVVTSGNPSGGPALIDAEAARQVLRGVADAFLMHDRRIARRVEDSVVTMTSAGLAVLRRSRGYAPLPIRLPLAAREPVLAVGGHLKNTACLVVGDLAYLTPHLGDLEDDASEAAWRRDVESFERLLGVRADVLAHDLHPDYVTTRFARERSARRRIAVQHHVAHVQAVLAELGVREPVLGVTFDGSGFGTDGTAWGAEFSIVDGARFTRVASFRPLPLPGGERAIREVWRTTFAALHDCFGAEALPLARRLRVFDAVPGASLETLTRMIEAGVGTVRARGMGRWFDVFGALALTVPRAGFEGHVALALEEAAEPLPAPPYPVLLPGELALDAEVGAAHEVDLRPAFRAAVADVLDAVPPARISARFHQTIVEATSAVVARVLGATGLSRVVLTGGSFQNRILERGVRERVGSSRVLMPREVPVNDGGLALGQAWAAVLALEAGTN